MMRNQSGHADSSEISELEKIARKCESLIICDVPRRKCELRGDYWKCYMGNFTKCPIYLQYITAEQ